MYSPIIDKILERLDILEEKIENALTRLEQLETERANCTEIDLHKLKEENMLLKQQLKNL